MGNFRNKKSIQIVDAIEYNGKYVDVSSLKKKLLTGCAVLVIVLAVISVPLLLI